MTELTDAELDRYARQIVTREVSGAGQARLKASRVVVVGAGGVFSPAIQYLAAAGVGRLTLIGDDSVVLSHLQRQTLFGDADIGAPKVAAAAGAGRPAFRADRNRSRRLAPRECRSRDDYVTGNTVIDALQATRGKLEANPSLATGLDVIAEASPASASSLSRRTGARISVTG